MIVINIIETKLDLYQLLQKGKMKKVFFKSTNYFGRDGLANQIT